jgi:ankyrin repeat protein
LSFPEQDHRFNRIVTAKDTCSWLFEHPEYKTWTSTSQGFLLLKGHPGSGKSVLMKHAVAETTRSQREDVVAYFFVHGQGNDLQKTSLGMYRALLNSMLVYFPEYLTHITKIFTKQQTLHGSYTEDMWEWTTEELRVLLSLILIRGSKTRPVMLFIDALDECGEDSAEQLFVELQDIMEDAKREGSQVKICVSCRYYPNLDDDSVPTIFVQESNHDDIRLVVENRLRHIRSQVRRDEVREQILIRAQGGFQWASLITNQVVKDIKNGKRPDELQERIASLPEDLDELYTRVLSTTNNDEQRQMGKLFQWVLFAQRPLSTLELREALATDKEMTCTTVSELRCHQNWKETPAQFEQHVRYLSRGLVEFQTRELYEEYEPGGEASDREALLIHQSVADYLSKTFLCTVGCHQCNTLVIGAGHFEISRSCLRYLALPEVIGATQLLRSRISAKFPLAPYATQYIFSHIRKVEQHGILQLDLLQLFQWNAASESWGELTKLWRVFDPSNAHTPSGWPFVGTTTAHILVAFRSKSALEALLETGNVDLGRRNADGDTPLLLATKEYGQENIACLLLDRMQKHDFDISDEDERTPLSWAADTGQDAVVKLLLDSGSVDADAKDGFGETPLIRAASNGHCAVVKMLLETQMVDVNARGSGGRSPLLLAATNGHDTVVELLLDTGQVNADARNEDEWTPLFGAAARGHDAVVKLLLNTCQVNANARDKRGRTPLSWATSDGHTAVVKLLLDTDQVNVNSRNLGGWTPLMEAAEHGSSEVLKLLLHTGQVDINAQDRNGQTPLSLAAQHGQDVVVKLLLHIGQVDINAEDRNGRTPLSLAAQHGQDVVVKLLLDTDKVNVNEQDINGRTPLSWAASDGHAVVAKLLLDTSQVNVDLRNLDGWTPLIEAAAHGRSEVLKLLLHTGQVDINAQDRSRRTPLSWAAQHGHDIVVKLLLNTDQINVNAQDINGRTPLSWAASDGHAAVAKLLLDTSQVNVDLRNLDGWTPLMEAAAHGSSEVLKLLLHTGQVDINAQDRSRRTPLSRAAEHGHDIVVKLLLNTDQINVNAQDINSRPPLSWAASDGHAAVAKLLLDTSHINVDLRNLGGWTPLMEAAAHGRSEVLELLLHTGQVDINAQDLHGRTPLSVAAQHGLDIVVKLLLNTDQININIQDEDGRTPLSWAASGEHIAVVNLLRDADHVAR